MIYKKIQFLMLCICIENISASSMNQTDFTIDYEEDKKFCIEELAAIMEQIPQSATFQSFFYINTLEKLIKNAKNDNITHYQIMTYCTLIFLIKCTKKKKSLEDIMNIKDHLKYIKTVDTINIFKNSFMATLRKIIIRKNNADILLIDFIQQLFVNSRINIEDMFNKTAFHLGLDLGLKIIINSEYELEMETFFCQKHTLEEYQSTYETMHPIFKYTPFSYWLDEYINIVHPTTLKKLENNEPMNNHTPNIVKVKPLSKKNNQLINNHHFQNIVEVESLPTENITMKNCVCLLIISFFTVFCIKKCNVQMFHVSKSIR